MPRVTLEVSGRWDREWREFLATDLGRELAEEPVFLGDLVITAFLEAARKLARERPPARRKLDRPMRRVLPLFNDTDVLTPPEIELVLGLESGQGEALCREWAEAGFLEPDPIHPGRFVLGRDVVRETNEITHRTALWVKKGIPAGPALNREKK
ncbi:MAG: hypothetical protein KJ621_01475 [Proteobacteria bacterium]|nr:hypothetical protein [Pseudomonadota bacterium]